MKKFKRNEEKDRYVAIRMERDTTVVEKDDWRLQNDVEHLKKAAIHPTDGEELCKHAPHLKRCEFCFQPVQDTPHQWWFVPEDLSGCICEECYNDFKDDFEWKELDGWDVEWFV